MPGSIVGVGTGSTVNCFIDALATMKGAHRRRRLEQRGEQRAAACARHRGARRERGRQLPVYIDGADEIDRAGCMIKGGGGALTREKIVADMAERFVCIADESKLVDAAGALSAAGGGDPDGGRAGRRAGFTAIGGEPVLRDGVVTDNGGHILDVHGLAIAIRRRWSARSTSGRASSASASSRATGPRVPARHRRGRAYADFLIARAGCRRRKARNLGRARFCNSQEGRPVAKPNYSFEKRQRELAKKKKKEEKEKEKAERKASRAGDGDVDCRGARGDSSGRSAGEEPDRRLNAARRRAGSCRRTSKRATAKRAGSTASSRSASSGIGAPLIHAASTCAPSAGPGDAARTQRREDEEARLAGDEARLVGSRPVRSAEARVAPTSAAPPDQRQAIAARPAPRRRPPKVSGRRAQRCAAAGATRQARLLELRRWSSMRTRRIVIVLRAVAPNHGAAVDRRQQVTGARERA